MRIGKFLSAVVALAMVVALAACAGPEEVETPPDEPQQPPQPDQEEQAQVPEPPADTTLRLDVPKMSRIKDAPVPDTRHDDEASLRDFVGIHLDWSEFPWDEEPNVYIAGHRLGYPGFPSYLAFWDIDNLAEGDEVTLTDANGTVYAYRVFRSVVVEQDDLSVTEAIPGRNILTLQSCTLPDYRQFLIVQAQLEDVRA